MPMVRVSNGGTIDGLFGLQPGYGLRLNGANNYASSLTIQAMTSTSNGTGLWFINVKEYNNLHLVNGYPAHLQWIGINADGSYEQHFEAGTTYGNGVLTNYEYIYLYSITANNFYIS